MRRSISNARPVPQRTCAACRQVKDKRALVRLVRTPAGKVEIDATGKKEGRGAYLCRESACWEKALKGTCLEHALKGSVSRGDLEKLYKNGKDLLKELTIG
ncbi:MAG: YlxR family protein [Dehalococcoidales bacterium]|jgi:hypothetical protein